MPRKATSLDLPGHNGGIFYGRSPIGRIFVEHLGEAVFRDDLDNSVLDLGDLLTHEGPALAAQREAAQHFGAERTYFVLNGTSTSNKIGCRRWWPRATWCCSTATTTRRRITAPCSWAAAFRSILETDRNAYGLIGPIDYRGAG